MEKKIQFHRAKLESTHGSYREKYQESMSGETCNDGHFNQNWMLFVTVISRCRKYSSRAEQGRGSQKQLLCWVEC
jgi:hypothetical protein